MKNYELKQSTLKSGKPLYTLYIKGINTRYVFISHDEAQRFIKAFNLDSDISELKELSEL